ncbi:MULTISPECIES: magnesium transporter MgtE N-terminal domain-containing protein [unclassified Thioalkalivibrio]|uniref:magnesium transporter MgtE N-terminal domain-containing protein n=1 Tax=unclassified Thioalkalivibrio TaxID=2621013 RepID=UPI0003700260|nr:MULTISPECIES: hypothetical protein [unclassified Thioalkalivibrio]
MNPIYAENLNNTHFPGTETATVGPILWQDERPDAALEVVHRALRGGEPGTARLRLMQLTENAQADVVRRLSAEDTASLARGLSNYALARICERLPDADVHEILESLPAFKRRGVEMILVHRRNR